MHLWINWPSLYNHHNQITWRLPTELQPVRYRLYINPNLTSGECEGTVSIQFQLNAPTNLIVLHTKNTTVDNLSVHNMMARMRIAIDKYYVDETRELLIIELRETLQLNKAYTVSIGFSCNLDGLVGAYRSSYTDESGNTK